MGYFKKKLKNNQIKYSTVVSLILKRGQGMLMAESP